MIQLQKCEAPSVDHDINFEINLMHQFLNKKILKVFNLTSNQNIIVYEDGSIQKGETTAEKKVTQV